MPTEVIETPIAIVGAGPTGLTAANLLGQLQVPATIFDSKHGPVEEPRAVSIDDEALRVMQRLGILDEMLPEIISGGPYFFLDPAGRCFAKAVPTRLDFAHPKRSNLHQPDFESRLFSGLNRFSSIRQQLGWRFSALEQDPEGVTLHFDSRDAGPQIVRAEYVLACDGGRSAVREAVGIRMRGNTYRKQWLVVDTVDPRGDTVRTFIHCDPRRPRVCIPGPGGARRWEFMLLDGETREEMETPQAARRLLARYGDDGAVQIRRICVYTFHARCAERWREGRVFLAGDAAHLTAPFGGQGMNSGIRDALNWSWKAAALMRGEMTPAILATYESERAPHAQQTIQMAVRIGRVMMPPTMARAYLLSSLFRAMSIVPRVKDYFENMRFRPVPKFTSGFLCHAGETATSKFIGRPFPQTSVALSDGPQRLLDDVLGLGFALLGYGATMPADFPVLTRRCCPHAPCTAVWVYPQSTARFAARHGVACVGDAGGALAAFLGALRSRPGLFLIRPDKVVAAHFSAERAAEVAAALAAFFRRRA